MKLQSHPVSDLRLLITVMIFKHKFAKFGGQNYIDKRNHIHSCIMKNRRLKEIGLSFSVILSLLISSITACACLHHQEANLAPQPSCHEHSEMPMTMEMPAESNQADAGQPVFSSNPNCSCVKPAPKAFSKSDFLKIEKQTAEITPIISFQAVLLQVVVAGNAANFAQPFQLSDSSYNIKSPRAPPCL